MKDKHELGLRNRVAIVTGGGRGIGRATSLVLAARGATPVIVDVERASAEQVAAEVSALGAKAMAFQADVRSYARAQEVAAEVVERTGRIDILVNNAGITQPKAFLDLSEEDWDLTIDVHLKGSFNWSQAVLPYMIRKQWGRIVSISSMVAKHGGAFPAVSKTAYAAAKAGILGLTRGLAREAAPFVTVNAVCPGVVDTGMARVLLTPEKMRLTLDLIPLARLAEPSDIANAVVFLASEAAGYITGEVIDVNGGVYID